MLIVGLTVLLLVVVLIRYSQVERDLRQSEARLRSTLNSLPLDLWVNDAEGRCILQNPPSIEMWGNLIGKTLDEVEVSTTTRAAWLSDHERVMKGETLRGDIDYDFRGEKRNYYYVTAPIQDSDTMIGIVGFNVDITNLKRAEAALRQNEAQAQQFLEQLRTLQKVTAELASVETFDELCRRAVDAGHHQLKFDRMSIWFLDDDPNYMLGSFGTDEEGDIRDERQSRLLADEELFPRNKSQMTIQNRQVYFQDNSRLLNDRAEVVGTGWNAMAYLTDRGQIFGSVSVDNFFSRQPVEANQLELLALYCNTLSALLVRKRVENSMKRAEDALRRNEEISQVFLERLRALQKVTVQLTKEETLDDLCRQAIDLGRKQLNFDRMGIWLLDNSDDYMKGTFGTSEAGDIRDERYVKVPANQILFPQGTVVQILKDTPIHFQEETPLLNELSEIVGMGWKAMGQLTRGEKVIGSVSVDNFLSRRPIEPFQLEVFALYCHTLGTLIVRKQAETALKESEARFRSVFKGADLGITIVDKDGFILSANPALEQMVGYSANELRHLTFASITHPDDRGGSIELFEKLLAHNIDRYEMEKRYIRKDGTVFWIRINVSRIPGDDSDQVMALVEDINARVQAEIEVRELTSTLERRVEERTAELQTANERLTELDRLKSKFISDITHELRTPLAVLNTRVYLLENGPAEKFSNHLAALKSQLDRLTNFVNTVLDLSRLELGRERTEMGSINLNSVVTQIVSALSPRAELSGLQIFFVPDELLPDVRGEVNQLAQVVTNLVANAINYTSEGKVDVRTGWDRELGRVYLEVCDTGMGISQNDIPHIFTRFYRGEQAGQTTIAGTGLGLSIVKEIVDIHDGSIEVDSIIGEGTTFRIWLPLIDKVD
ncbi:MAG: PAS domain S-box protein [Anaerolineae bacterium]